LSTALDALYTALADRERDAALLRLVLRDLVDAEGTGDAAFERIHRALDRVTTQPSDKPHDVTNREVER
jgi:hypothetical protein